MLISIITPVKNGASLIRRHYRDVSAVLSDSRLRYEIVYVDDGSSDNSESVITALTLADDRVRGFTLNASYGQQMAIIAGLSRSRGDFIVTLDVDLDVPADVIPAFVSAMQDGADYISGVRTVRKKRGAGRLLGSVVFDRIMRARTRLPIHDFGCGATALPRALADRVLRSRVKYRGLKDLCGQLAVKIANVPVSERYTAEHDSSYGLRELYRALFVEHHAKIGVKLPDELLIREVSIASPISDTSIEIEHDVTVMPKVST